MLCQFGGKGRCGSRRSEYGDGPIELAEPHKVELADNAQDATVEQTPVAARTVCSEDPRTSAKRLNGARGST